MVYLNGTIPAGTTPLETHIMMMDFWKAKKPFYDIITANHLHDILMERSIQSALKKDCLLLMPLAPASKERDTDMTLNGRDLVLGENWELPDLSGEPVSAGKIELAPMTCTFLVCDLQKQLPGSSGELFCEADQAIHSKRRKPPFSTLTAHFHESIFLSCKE